MYVLPFDHGVASCGMVLRGEEEKGEGESKPEQTWQQVLKRYPTLAASFAEAEATRPLEQMRQVPYRRSAAAGDGWVLLPHSFAFSDPLFSTGMAWSLLAVERLADVLAGEGDAQEYGRLLVREADHIEALVSAAYAALPDFDAFTATTFLYFAAASFAESRQRLLPASAAAPPGFAWEAFLGAEDEVLVGLPERARERLEASGVGEDFRSWLLQTVAPRDVAGLGDAKRHNLYPLDLEVLEQRAELLGLTPEEVRAALPRLRGQR